MPRYPTPRPPDLYEAPVSDSDAPRPPRHTPGRYPSITEDDEREDTQQVLMRAIAGLKDADQRRVKARLSVTSSPPAAKMAGPILISVLSAAAFAIVSAALTVYVNGELTKSNQAGTDRALVAIKAELHEHENLWMHSGAREATATQRAQIEALTERVKRIEAQQDAPRRQR